MSDYITRLSAEQRRSHVEALKRERLGYEQRGEKDRAEQVDASIRAFEGSPVGRSEAPKDQAPQEPTPEPEPEPAKQTAAKRTPRKRRG